MKKIDEIPSFEKLMLPVLEYAGDGKEHSINDTEEYLAKQFQLTVEQRKKRKPSGYEHYFLGRIRWARLYLRKAGLISNTEKKAHYQITSNGKKFLETKPKSLNTKILMEFPDFKKWKTKIYVDRDLPKNATTKDTGIVVLLDFLGTKGIWKQSNSRQLIKQWVEFIQSFEKEITSKLEMFGTTTFDAFSDTIIITIIPKNMEESLAELSNILSLITIESMIIQRPLRGCISIGKIIKDNSLILGNAIDEAEEYYELPQWIGISATASTHREIEKIIKKRPLNQNLSFQLTDIPLDSSIEQNAWAINWPDFADPQQIQQMSKNWGEKFETMNDVFYANMKDLSKIRSSLKWRNTVKFFEHDNMLES